MTTQDQTREPDDWILRDCGDAALDDDRWHCHRHDHKVWAFGATQEAAIAAAWREVGRVDLYALGARLCSENILERRAHGHGYILLDGHRVRPDGEEPTWALCIDTSFGAPMVAIEDMRKAYGEYSDFDISDGLPSDDAAEQCEVLCRVLYDDGDENIRSSFGLEIVMVDSKPAIEAWP